jgi:hypothetical protein
MDSTLRERLDLLRWRLEALSAEIMASSCREAANDLESEIRAIREELGQVERKLLALTNPK